MSRSSYFFSGISYAIMLFPNGIITIKKPNKNKITVRIWNQFGSSTQPFRSNNTPKKRIAGIILFTAFSKIAIFNSMNTN